MKLVELEAQVLLHDDSDVAITVVIGEGQIGGGVIKLGGEKKANAPINDFVLGNATSLKGKTVLVKSIVSDENPSTNKTSVTYTFVQNKKEQEFVSKAEVDDEKDIIGYWGKFTFM